MGSKLGTALPRRSVAWLWFVVAVLLTIILARAAFLGTQSWWPASIFFGIACVIYLEPRLRRCEVESVQVDEFGVLRVEGEVREEVAWSELSEIRIITTSGGPYQEDVFFALTASGGKGCLIPHAAAVRTKLLEEMQERFPGIDDKMVIEAMGCTSSNSFVVWKRAA